MVQLGITAAAKLTGKGRQTIYRAVQAGTLSATRDAHGHVAVDIAELERVYGPLSRPAVPREAAQDVSDGDTGPRLAVLEERLRQLEERVQEQRRELDGVREEKGRLLALLEAQTAALVDQRNSGGGRAGGLGGRGLGAWRVPQEGIVNVVRRWLFGAPGGGNQDGRDKA